MNTKGYRYVLWFKIPIGAILKKLEYLFNAFKNNFKPRLYMPFIRLAIDKKYSQMTLKVINILISY